MLEAVEESCHIGDPEEEKQRNEAFQRVQQMVNSVQPPSDCPFGAMEDEEQGSKPALPQLVRDVEPTTTQQKTTDYTSVRQESTVASNPLDQEAEEEDFNPLAFIELKFCTVCHLEMPLRTKHCKQCDQCVATHDHHCPWIGTCIGERNKAHFYVYICFQLLQTVFGTYFCFEICEKLGFKFESLSKYEVMDGAYEAFLGVVCLCISISLSVLLTLHTYLAMNGLTSWEYFSWMNISYLKAWPRKYGSPFSKGSKIENFKAYF